jgi:hypothetical protein
MSNVAAVRILEEDPNRRGDLFGRLMSDLFVSLGYDHVRLNIPRSGREIDIEAEHRLERRAALAECKALSDPVGGKELNTFRGKLPAERRRHEGVAITPYFVSLSGFTETAIDQEVESGDEAVVLVDGRQVVTELVKGRILVSLEQATEKAGRLTAGLRGLQLDRRPEVLAHDQGWLWAVYYTQGKQRTHFVLVHADGTPLTSAVAGEVIEADQTVGGILQTLTCLNPQLVVTPAADQLASAALAKYYQHLGAECGYILLDGLPADAEVGSRKLRLENLFVPLHLVVRGNGDVPRGTGPDSEAETRRSEKRQPVGEVLAESPRLAILASPGGGKSTLLKRLAVAYADPDRRMLAEDRLPSRGWLPLLFRCRELRDQAPAPFPELIDNLAARALLGEHAGAFRAAVDRRLREGEVLLLIDGLDEISDPGDRAAFVRNLRAFLGVYPNIGLVVTSREAGFRRVAGLLATVCLPTRLAEFDPDDIRRLSVAWHREVVGDRPEVATDAERLASAIIGNDRIRRLAVNPLLLTTLLLVKRWVGRLPTRRSLLYGKAVEVLLMTWNVEGFDPIDQDEALPQLCYLAYAMMQGGVQKISRPDLTRLLREARSQLSVELGFARIAVAEFIERVELRSSLLMMTGHDVVDGELTEFYEFRHLTFQEYLTAKAIVEGWYPDRKESDTLVSVLEPHFGEEKWREVIPLAAVLAGRKADRLIGRLARLVLDLPKPKQRYRPGTSGTREAEDVPVYLALGHCLADETQATPETLREGVRALISCSLVYFGGAGFTSQLARSKYADILRDEAVRSFLAGDPDYANPGGALAQTVLQRLLPDYPVGSLETALDQLKGLLRSAEVLQRCEGALGTMMIAFRIAHRAAESGRARCPNLLGACADALLPLVLCENPPEHFAACWALAWIGRCRVWTPPQDPNVLNRLFTLWQTGTNEHIRRQAAWAFSTLPLLPRESEPLRGSPDAERFVSLAGKCYSEPEFDMAPRAALVAAYYLRSPWSDAQLVDLVAKHQQTRRLPEWDTLQAALGMHPEGPPRRRIPSRKPRRRAKP